MIQVVAQAAVNAALAQAVQKVVQSDSFVWSWITNIDGRTNWTVPAANGGVVFAFLMFTQQSQWKQKVTALDVLLDQVGFNPTIRSKLLMLLSLDIPIATVSTGFIPSAVCFVASTSCFCCLWPNSISDDVFLFWLLVQPLVSHLNQFLKLGHFVTHLSLRMFLVWHSDSVNVTIFKFAK
jgi:hypothetical protein